MSQCWVEYNTALQVNMVLYHYIRTDHTIVQVNSIKKCFKLFTAIVIIALIIIEPSEVKQQPSEQSSGAKQAGAKLTYNTKRYHARRGYHSRCNYTHTVK